MGRIKTRQAFSGVENSRKMEDISLPYTLRTNRVTMRKIQLSKLKRFFHQAAGP